VESSNDLIKLSKFLVAEFSSLCILVRYRLAVQGSRATQVFEKGKKQVGDEWFRFYYLVVSFSQTDQMVVLLYHYSGFLPLDF
jgi:hypothetical protein